LKILIIQTAFIGDVVLATPLIEKLSERYPEGKIDFLVRKGNENLLENDPRLNQVLVLVKKEKKYSNLLKMIRRVRKGQYDLVINVQRFFTTGLITLLSGGKETIGFKKNPLSFTFTRKIEHKIRDYTHEVSRNLRLIAHLVDDKLIKPSLVLSEGHLKKVQEFQATPYIVLAPTSVWFTKQFPKEKWAEFLKELDFEGAIYLVGAPADHESCEEIINDSGKGINLCGKLSLMESAALMKGAKMNYVNDSAPMHFASAVNAPTCAIFCSTVEEFGFGPLADDSVVVEVEEELNCRPCGLHGKKACPEGHFKCGNNIDVERLKEIL